MLNFLKSFKRLPFLLEQLMQSNKQHLDNVNINLGKLLAQNNMTREKQIIENIALAEFKIFSQWGDDGIIQFLVDYLNVQPKTFIEFGVESYQECNTRFLLINNNWRGLIIDGSKSNMDMVRKESIYWRFDLTAIDVFITKENINELFTANGFSGEIGLLSVDIDGNDYWVWKEIDVVNPVIVVAEYNSVFGSENPWTVLYDKDFYRTKAHFSNLYYGASLQSLCDLAEEKGYSFVGSNSNGNNAYFVRKDKLGNLKALTAKEGYVKARFSEGRNDKGELLFQKGNENKLDLMKGMPVYNTRTKTIEKIS